MLHYYVKGNGKNIVFLHGWGGSMASFEFVARAMSRGRRVLNLDLPGFGESDPPGSDWGVEEYAECVRSLLADLKMTPCVLVGHSFGGRIAIMLASRYPELIEGVVLTDSAGIRPRLSLGKRIRQAQNKRRKRKGLSVRASQDYVSAGAMRGTLVRVVNQDLTPLLPEIKAPTLLFWGSLDKDTPLWMAKKMKKLIPNAGLVVVKGGHYAYLEHGHLFIRVLDTFLESLPV